jgi:hypothetical protein
MQNIYEKIDTMFSGQNDDRPVWAVEILDELRELKELLKEKKATVVVSSNNTTQEHTPQHSFLPDYFEFIKELRKRHNDSVSSEDILWKNQRLGISEGGLIYNKNTERIYSTTDAKIIYRDLYNSYYNLDTMSA